MFIKYLRIEKDGKAIRHIAFKPGVNLIVDTSSTDNQKDSGNNVGKTTVLRLVDYCLGGEAKAIYLDPEFKQTNSTVKDFLEQKRVLIMLCLGQSFTDNSQDIILKRNFLKRSEKIAEINGENILDIKAYRKALKLILFGTSTPKPTFRELMPRFIRSDASRMDKVIKYLHSTTTDNTYEGIYFFLLGCPNTSGLSAEKTSLNQKLKFNKRVLNDTFKKRTAAQIKQHLALIVADLEKLQIQKQNFSVNPQYEKEYNSLQNIKHEINKTSTELSKKQFRLQLIKESIQNIEKQSSAVDTESLKYVYSEAKHYIADLQKSFEDSVAFHNKLIANKIGYLSEDLPKLDAEIKTLRSELTQLLDKEGELGKKLITSGSLADYELIVSSANKFYEQKGRLEEELDYLHKIESSIEVDGKRIDEINDVINTGTLKETLEAKVTKFNQFFSTYSQQFYDERFILSPDYSQDSGAYKFNIANVDGNLGDGKKKGLIAAFDLAYISYANSEHIKSPQFVMHDRIEGIHGNQLRSLFDVVNSTAFNGQYIASVLSGKFSELQLANRYLDENKILELSQTDKLFKIEPQESKA
jgi:uncharacterized protein YydD (DUF2326 family)